MLVGPPKSAEALCLQYDRLWCLKMAVFDLLARLISTLPYERALLYVFWSVLLSTFVASIVTIFVGCHPVERYWQVYPDPGDWYGERISNPQA